MRVTTTKTTAASAPTAWGADTEAGHAQWYLERRHATLTIVKTAGKALKASSDRRNVISELGDASPCFQCLLRFDVWLDSDRQSA